MIEGLLPHEAALAFERILADHQVEVDLHPALEGSHLTVKRQGMFSIGVYSVLQGWSEERESNHILLRSAVVALQTTPDYQFINDFNIQHPYLTAVVTIDDDGDHVICIQRTLNLNKGVSFTHFAEVVHQFCTHIMLTKLAFTDAKE